MFYLVDLEDLLEGDSFHVQLGDVEFTGSRLRSRI